MSKAVRSPTRYIADIAFDTADTIIFSGLRILGYGLALLRRAVEEEEQRTRETRKEA